jgi:hypothetical protein
LIGKTVSPKFNHRRFKSRLTPQALKRRFSLLQEASSDISLKKGFTTVNRDTLSSRAVLVCFPNIAVFHLFVVRGHLVFKTTKFLCMPWIPKQSRHLRPLRPAARSTIASQWQPAPKTGTARGCNDCLCPPGIASYGHRPI